MLQFLMVGRDSETIHEQEVIAKWDKRAQNPFLVSSGLAGQPTLMPWFGGKRLLIQFAETRCPKYPKCWLIPIP